MTDVPSTDTIRRLCGNLLDGQVEAILALRPSIGQVEEAVAWASGLDDVMGEERKPLSGVTAAIYDILRPDEEEDDRR